MLRHWTFGVCLSAVVISCGASAEDETTAYYDYGDLDLADQDVVFEQYCGDLQSPALIAFYVPWDSIADEGYDSAWLGHPEMALEVTANTGEQDLVNSREGVGIVKWYAIEAAPFQIETRPGVETSTIDVQPNSVTLVEFDPIKSKVDFWRVKSISQGDIPTENLATLLGGNNYSNLQADNYPDVVLLDFENDTRLVNPSPDYFSVLLGNGHNDGKFGLQFRTGSMFGCLPGRDAGVAIRRPWPIPTLPDDEEEEGKD